MKHYARSEAKAYGTKNMRGIWAAIPYPFKENGQLDEAGLRRDIRKYIDQLKIDGFFCGGLVGEYWTLTMEERRRGQQIVVEEVGDKAQTLPHTTCLSVRDTVALTQHAQEIGATYAVVGNPPVTTRDPDELYQYYKALCAEVDIAISLFNTGICGYTLSPELVARIAELDNIFCVKNPMAPEHTEQVRRLVGDKILVCVPSEAGWLDNIVKYKDQVFMSSPDPYSIQVPGRLLMREYTEKAMAGDLPGARAVAEKLEPVRRVYAKWMDAKWREPSVPISVIKYWSQLLGFTGGNPREPGRPLSDERKRELKQDLTASGLL